VNPKIAGKWTFIPLKMVLIGIDPYPNQFHSFHQTNCVSVYTQAAALDTAPQLTSSILRPKCPDGLMGPMEAKLARNRTIVYQFCRQFDDGKYVKM
jgi:hypothetical protein